MGDMAMGSIMVIAIICIAGAAFASLTKGKRGQRSAFILLGILVADWILMMPLAWAESDGAIWSLPLSVYDVMCMVLFEGIADHLSEILLSMGIRSQLIIQAYSLLMLECYIATPILAATSVYSIVTKRFTEARTRFIASWYMRRKNGHLFILDGVDSRSISFVRSLFSEELPFKKSHDDSCLGGSKVCCIFTNISKEDRENNSDIIEEFSDKKVYYFERSARVLLSSINPDSIRQARDIYVMFFCGDKSHGERNLGGALDCLELFSGVVPQTNKARFSEGKPRYHVFCACHGESDELALDSVDGIVGFDVHVVDEHREAVYKLLWDHPLFESLKSPNIMNSHAPCVLKEQRLDVVILGCGEKGFETIRAIAWNGQLPHTKLCFYIIDKSPWKRFLSRFRHKMPGYFDAGRFCPGEGCGLTESAFYEDCDGFLSVGDFFSIAYYQADTETDLFDEKAGAIQRTIIKAHPAPFAETIQAVRPYCVVSLGGDDQNVDAAVRLRRILVGNGEPTVFPRIHIDVTDFRRYKTISALRVRGKMPDEIAIGLQMVPFGALEDIFNQAYQLNSNIDRIALNVNACYSGGYAKSNELLPDENFNGYSSWQMNILSSRATAISLKTKLWILGLALEENPSTEKCDDMVQLKKIMSNLETEFSENSLEAASAKSSALDCLARNEHQRWEAFYFGEGWMPMMPEESKILNARGLNAGRHDNHLLLKHPYLCSYDNLKTVSESLGKSDPRRFDLRMILDIPHILNDDIATSGKCFSVRAILD